MERTIDDPVLQELLREIFGECQLEQEKAQLEDSERASQAFFKGINLNEH
jgi:hypothetical protein